MNLRITLLVLALVVVSFAALALGPVPVDAGELWRVVTGGADPVARAIVLDVRAPRVALVRRGGDWVEVPIDTVGLGDVVLVRAGEVVP